MTDAEERPQAFFSTRHRAARWKSGATILRCHGRLQVLHRSAEPLLAEARRNHGAVAVFVARLKVEGVEAARTSRTHFHAKRPLLSRSHLEIPAYIF